MDTIIIPIRHTWTRNLPVTLCPVPDVYLLEGCKEYTIEAITALGCGAMAPQQGLLGTIRGDSALLGRMGKTWLSLGSNGLHDHSSNSKPALYPSKPLQRNPKIPLKRSLNPRLILLASMRNRVSGSETLCLTPARGLRPTQS